MSREFRRNQLRAAGAFRRRQKAAIGRELYGGDALLAQLYGAPETIVGPSTETIEERRKRFWFGRSHGAQPRQAASQKA